MQRTERFPILARVFWHALAYAATPAGAWANETSNVSPPILLEQIEVVGSHILGLDLETQHPVLIIDRPDIERTGLTSVADVAQQIVAGGEMQNRLYNGLSGEELVNLRSLGFNRTLVLLNGSRFVTDIGGATDLSTIPLSMVDRIEVLLDSASAIYGSDAIAGVINIITRSDMAGGNLRVYYGQTDHDDGVRQTYELSLGRKADRWSASIGFEYTHDEPIWAGARARASVPIYGLPVGVADLTGSRFTPYTWFITSSALNSCGFCASRLIDGRPGLTPDDFRPVDPTVDAYNWAPRTYLQIPQQRRAAFAQARHEFSPTLAFSVDALFNQRRSAQHDAEPNLYVDTIVRTDLPDSIAIPANNLYNPFGEPIVRARRRLVEAGPRLIDQTVDTRRLHISLNGAATWFGRDFLWEADAAETRAKNHETATPFADDRKLQLALGPSFRDAGGTPRCGVPGAVVDGCVPLNLFGPPGSITAAMLDYIDTSESNRENDRSRTIGLHASSADLAELPQGALAVAAGIEYRHESAAQVIDPLRASGNENGSGTEGSLVDSTRGAYSVREAYLEFEAGLLSNLALARKLDVTLGTRYSHYSNFGGTTNSQLGLRWKPIDDLLIRANYAQGLRTPAITELFQGDINSVSGQFAAIDPCDASNSPTPATLARCAALGVPANVDQTAQAGNVTQAGNPRLKPEKSRSRGMGFFYTPSWLEGFDISVDWYNLRLRNAIGDLGVQAVVDDCYIRNNNAACAQIVRSPVDGTLNHVTDTPQNLAGGIETEGYDIALRYRRDTSLGHFTIRWNTNYVDYFGEIGKPRAGDPLPDGALAQGNVVGLNSTTLDTPRAFGVIWRWRSQLQLIWERNPWSASITGRYFSHITEDCSVVQHVADDVGRPALRNLCSSPDRIVQIAGEAVPTNHVSSITYVDLQGGWEAPWKARITLGVRNAAGRNPPLAYTGSYSFFPDYDVPGRFFYASYRQDF